MKPSKDISKSYNIFIQNHSFSKSNKQKINRIKEEQRVMEQMIPIADRDS